MSRDSGAQVLIPVSAVTLSCIWTWNLSPLPRASQMSLASRTSRVTRETSSRTSCRSAVTLRLSSSASSRAASRACSLSNTPFRFISSSLASKALLCSSSADFFSASQSASALVSSSSRASIQLALWVRGAEPSVSLACPSSNAASSRRVVFTRKRWFVPTASRWPWASRVFSVIGRPFTKVSAGGSGVINISSPSMSK